MTGSRSVLKTVSLMATLILVVALNIPQSQAGTPPPPSQDGLLIFKMMILTMDDEGSSRVSGGQVSVAAEGGEPMVHPIDSDGLLSFTITSETTTRATFSGEFVPFTIRFEFEDGFLIAYNDSLPATQQEARLDYYLNLDGTYVVAYTQDYLYMLAPADPGGPIMGPFFVPAESAASDLSSDQIREMYNDDPPPPPPPPPSPRPKPCPPPYEPGEEKETVVTAGDIRDEAPDRGLERFDFDGFGVCPTKTNNTPQSNLSQRASFADEEAEVPTLEISLVHPDGTLAFLEWVPVGGSGIIGDGFQWATDLTFYGETPFVQVNHSLSADFLDALPPGSNVIAYRFIDSEGRGSNYRLMVLEMP